MAHEVEGAVVSGSELDRFAAWHLRAWDESSDVAWTTVDGTLCFVDISGFTALSEKLATLGRVGAEELTEVLNRVFGDMLGLAAERGGTLLKYGGDALLLLFEGQDHAVQAASATVEMRAALRKAADIPTSVGRVALRMSQGVHSGEVHLFRAQGSHAELIVAGPAASHVTEMEGTAEAGEIVVSSATKHLLPAAAATEPKGDGWILRWRTPKVPVCGHPPFASASSTDIASLVPTGLRSFLSAGSPDAEHRQATVAFVKIVGIDELLASDGPEPTATAFGKIISEITAIADEEEVTFLATDVDLDACKVILVSGVPTTRVDEEGRMLRAARRISDIDTPFVLKTGVNRGDVFSGEVGTTRRSTYTIMGDTVNLAARLMAAAPAGAIFATPAVIDRSGTLFETTEVEPFHVKGKSAPVRALSLGIETGTRPVHAGGLTKFVGRADELAVIDAAVAGLGIGSGTAFTITGPTGIGKTRLAEESMTREEVPVFEVRAEPYGTANPYRPFRDPVRDLLGVERASNDAMADALRQGLKEVAPGLMPLAPLLGDIAHIEMDPTPETAAIDGRFRQDRTADAMVSLLEATKPGRLAIIAEDMHWADAATEGLVTRLARETAGRSWLVLATARDSVIDDTTEMPLGPLETAALEEMIHAATEAAPLRPEVVSAIVERSGGSPLFASELITIVRETGDVSSLPTSLDGVVGSQIDSLAPLPRKVLRYVSVLGRSFRTVVARDLIRTQGIELDKATRSTLVAFLDEDGSDRLQFRHAMVRDIAYEGLSYRLRKELHNTAGELLLERFAGSEDSIADILALHFSEGGDVERAWKFCRIAGDHSMEMYANSEAAVQFTRAINASRSVPSAGEADRCEVLIKLGDVRERLGEFDASLEAYRRASGLTRSDPHRHGEVLLRRARAKERAGQYTAALAEVTRARKLAEGASEADLEAVRVQALGQAAVIRQAQQRPRAALRAADEAIEAARRSGNELALARALSVKDYALVMLGDLDAAINSNDALDIYRRNGRLEEEALIAQNLGVYEYWRGNWELALARYDEGRQTLARLGNAVEAAHAAANIGEVLVNQGRYDEAEEPLVSARRTYAATQFDEGIAFVEVLLGRMYGLRGDLDRSEDHLQSAIEASARLGLDGYSLEASIHLADALCRSGSPSRGLSALAEASRSAPAEYLDFYSPLFARINGSILEAAGQHQDAVSALEAGASVALERGDSYEAALLTLTLDRIDPDRVSDADRSQARETLRTLGVRSVPGLLVDL